MSVLLCTTMYVVEVLYMYTYSVWENHWIYMYMVHAQCKYIRDDPNTYVIMLSINM